MGVITTADEIRSNLTSYNNPIKDQVKLTKSTREDLEKMIDNDTWGGDEWNDEFKTKIRKNIKRLYKIEQKLKQIQTDLI